MITERAIQRVLWLHLSTRVICAMPNYTPPHWWECDFCAITKARLFVEYEIKLTLSDLRADAKKESRVICHQPGSRRPFKSVVIGKYDALKNSSPDGPTRFFYVVPESLVGHVPDWAGVWVVSERYGHVSASKEREATRLHSHKVDRGFVADMQTSAYWRFWRQRTGETSVDGSAA